MGAALVFILGACCYEAPKPLSGRDRVTLNVKEAETEKKIELSEKHRKAAARLETYFSGLHLGNAFNGNVLVARHDTIIFQKSYGKSHLSRKVPLNDSSLFQLASVSKVLTACLTLQLAEQGKIHLEADVQRYLPDFPYPGITVKMLLTHRSGLFNYIYFCTDYCTDKHTKLSNDDVLCMISSYKPNPYFKPDRRFYYNNTNYMLLALIAERATGKDFKTLMRKNIFEKCNMHHTVFADELQDRENVCRGFTCSNIEVGGDIFDHVWGDKGIYSTTGDLFRFQRAYFSGKLISPVLVFKAIEPSCADCKLKNYGFGWRMLYADSPDKLVYHNGWWHGFRSAFHHRLKDRTVVIILSNRLDRSVYNTWEVFALVDRSQAIQASK